MIQQLTDEKNKAVNSATALYNSANPDGSGSDKGSYISSISSNYDPLIQSDTQSRDNSINNYKSQADYPTSSANTCIGSLTALQSKIESADNYCYRTYTNGVSNNGDLMSCQCSSGYVMSNNLCIAMQSYCQQQGESYDSTTKSCVDPAVTTSASPVVTPAIAPPIVSVQKSITTTNVLPKNTQPLSTSSDNNKPEVTPQASVLQAPSATIQASTPQPINEGFFVKVWHFFSNLF